MEVFINDYSLLALLNLIQESPPDGGHERCPYWLKSRIFLIKSDGKRKQMFICHGLRRNAHMIYINFIQSKKKKKQEPNLEAKLVSSFLSPRSSRDRCDQAALAACWRSTVRSQRAGESASAETDEFLCAIVLAAVYVCHHLDGRVCTRLISLRTCAVAYVHLWVTCNAW